MRTFRLLAAAAEAEGLRLKRNGAELGRRAVMMAVAGVCGVAALIMLHVAVYNFLYFYVGPAGAAGIVALADLLIAGIFLMLAKPRHDPVAQEALMLRREMVRAAVGPGAIGSSLWRPMASIGGMIATMMMSRRR